MNIFSVVIILLILLSGVVGFKRGVLKEVVTLVGTIVIYLIAFQLKNPLANFFMKFLPLFDFAGNLKDVIVLNIVVYQLIAFAIIVMILFALFNIILKVTGIFQKLIDLTIILTLPSKILGGIVGLISGYIYVFILLIVFSIPLGGIDLFKDSKVVTHILYDSPILSQTLGGFKDAVQDIYIVTDQIVAAEEGNQNTLNLEVMDILLKNKVTTSKDMLKLMEEKEEFEHIVGLREVIYRYQ